MGQLLHGSARTTAAVRRAIQQSRESIAKLAKRYDLNPKTVAKWKKRPQVHDAPMGPKPPRSTILTREEEALIVAFRKHTLLPLDDCLYALQAMLPHLPRSTRHRCLQRHGLSCVPDMAGEKTGKQPFRSSPIGDFHLDIAEVRTEEGKLSLFVAIDRPCKFADAELHEEANKAVAA
jgi:transposase-like protein